MTAAQELVLVGGGHTHALVLEGWARDRLPGVALTLVTPEPTAPYTGMLPGFIAGHYPRDTLEIDLAHLCERAGARLLRARVTGLDRAARRLHLSDGTALPYDIAALDVGITSDLPQLPGYTEHAVSAKPLGNYARRWEAWRAHVAAGAVSPRIAVIGGGVAGVELALAMAHRLRDLGAEITVIEAQRMLPNIGARARKRLLAHLDHARVRCLEQAEVTEISPDGVSLQDGTQIAASLVLGAAGSRPQDWLRDTGLHLTDGFVTVGPTLQAVQDAAIFAVGDCAHMAHAPRPKAGVYAVRQAPVLQANLRAALTGGPMRRYTPQRDYLKLISLGDRRALADKWALPLEGRWLWWLKDRIDARFMAQFRA